MHATGITLSAEQRSYILSRAEGQVDVRLQDYRELTDEPFDAVSSIEMGEHVGEENYPTYAATLHRMLKPTGRLVLQQMSRGAVAPGGGAFIETYIAPDMTMRPVGSTLNHLSTAGFEIRDVEAMREHYVLTCRAWSDTLERRWPEITSLNFIPQRGVGSTQRPQRPVGGAYQSSDVRLQCGIGGVQCRQCHIGGEQSGGWGGRHMDGPVWGVRES